MIHCETQVAEFHFSSCMHAPSDASGLPGLSVSYQWWTQVMQRLASITRVRTIPSSAPNTQY